MNSTRRIISVLLGIVVCVLGVAATALADAIPSIDEPLVIPRWRAIGPFPSGVREAGTDPLSYFGEQPFDEPLLKGSFPTYLTHDAKAHWKYVDSDEDGNVVIDYPDITEEDWDLITGEWGFAGALYTGIAYGAIVIEEGPRRALVDLQNSGGFRLNGMPYQGDSYGHNMWMQPVVLQEGRNEFQAAFSHQGSFRLRILPVENDVLLITNDTTLPDLIRGWGQTLSFSVPVTNTTTRWLRDPWIRLSSDVPGLSGMFSSQAPVPPLGVLSFQVREGLTLNVPPDLDVDEVEVEIEFCDGKNGPVLGSGNLKFRVRNPADGRRETFWSPSTNSVQYFALKPPAAYDPQKKYSLILYMHGAGCEAQGYAESFEARDWAFIVAATNCRPFGFDWQDWGSLNLLETLAEVERRYPIDDSRIHLAGHSMGGHGTWFNALVFPDLWADATPSAGWTTFDLYVPMFLRKNVILGEPRAQLIWNLGMREENTLMLTENALNLPILALEGGADDNVPPQQPKMLVELLSRRGYDITYHEEPGQGHWWDFPDTPGQDCVDATWVNDFRKQHVRDLWPKKVVYRTHNYSVNNRACWVTIDRPMRAYRDIKVEAEVVAPRTVRVKTTNIEGLTLRLPERLIGGIKATPEAGAIHGGKVTANIDGVRFTLDQTRDDTYSFRRAEHGSWQTGEVVVPSLAKTPKLYGPWKQALMRPFVLVYGTQGTEEENEWSFALARSYAHAWWYRANGSVWVVADTEPIPEFEEYPNLILLGGPKMNAVTARLEAGLPIKLREDGVVVANRLIRGQNLAAKFVFPNPEHPDTLVLVQEGQSLSGFKRLFSFTEIYSGAGFPDWMVWGDEVKLLGLGGACALGFFNLNWEVDNSLTFWNEELISDQPDVSESADFAGVSSGEWKVGY